MDLLALLQLVLTLTDDAVVSVGRVRRGVASVFYTGKDGRHAGGGLACLWRHPKGQHVDRRLRFVAHRTLKCGTIVRIRSPRTGLSTYAAAADKGPYGAMHEGKWVLKIRRSDPGRWRGELDLSPGTAEAIEHNGFERVEYQVVRLPEEDPPESIRRPSDPPRP